MSAAAAPNGIHHAHAGASPAASSAGAAGFVEPAGSGPRPARLPQQHAGLYRARLAAAQRPDSVVAQILGAGVGTSPNGAAAAPAPVAAALWPARRPGAPIGAPLLLVLAALGLVAVVVPSIFLGVALLRAQDGRAAPEARARLQTDPAQLAAGAAAGTGPQRTVSVLDQRFGPASQAWPDDPHGTAWMASGAYRLYARDVGRFVAVGAPIAQPLRDVVVTAAFHKVGGPAGGGYGVIVRDQTPGARDGLDQGGRYYVLEVGDPGDFGIWRRDGDQWIELVPWTRTPAVRPGSAANELTVRATGPTLSLQVNGVLVASILDEALPAGGVGVFAGGDLNEVALDRFSVQVPG